MRTREQLLNSGQQYAQQDPLKAFRRIFHSYTNDVHASRELHLLSLSPNVDPKDPPNAVKW